MDVYAVCEPGAAPLALCQCADGAKNLGRRRSRAKVEDYGGSFETVGEATLPEGAPLTLVYCVPPPSRAMPVAVYAESKRTDGEDGGEKAGESGRSLVCVLTAAQPSAYVGTNAAWGRPEGKGEVLLRATALNLLATEAGGQAMESALNSTPAGNKSSQRRGQKRGKAEAEGETGSDGARAVSGDLSGADDRLWSSIGSAAVATGSEPGSRRESKRVRRRSAEADDASLPDWTKVGLTQLTQHLELSNGGRLADIIDDDDGDDDDEVSNGNGRDDEDDDAVVSAMDSVRTSRRTTPALYSEEGGDDGVGDRDEEGDEAAVPKIRIQAMSIATAGGEVDDADLFTHLGSPYTPKCGSVAAAAGLPTGGDDDGPPGRWGLTATTLATGEVLAFGGQGSGGKLVANETHVYDARTGVWTRLDLAADESPGKRMGHTATLTRKGQVYLFGGSKYKRWLNDIWVFSPDADDGPRWSKVETHGTPPTTAYHSATLSGNSNEIYIFGGVVNGACSNALTIYDLDGANFYEPIVLGDAPSPRSGHSATQLRDGRIVLFGGWDEPVCYNDVHVLDCGTMEWQAIATTGKAPSPRSWHQTVALDPTHLLVYGGYNGSAALDDVFVLDVEAWRWHPAAAFGIKLPDGAIAKRAGHAVVTCPVRGGGDNGSGDEVDYGVFVIAGGNNDDVFFNDATRVDVLA